MDLQTLRNQAREMYSECPSNLTDSILNDLIEYATQEIEADYAKDHIPTPRQMMARDSGTITASGYPLPSDFLRARSVSIGDSVLRYAPPEKMPQESQNEDATVNLIYYANLPKLVNDTDTNWLLDIASRVYVYATCIQIANWSKDAPAVWATYYATARDATGRANSPRSSGGWQRAKGEQRGHYSIVGANMIFGYSY